MQTRSRTFSSPTPEYPWSDEGENGWSDAFSDSESAKRCWLCESQGNQHIKYLKVVLHLRGDSTHPLETRVHLVLRNTVVAELNKAHGA